MVPSHFHGLVLIVVTANYLSSGLCPVAEKLHNETFLGMGLCHHFYTEDEIDLIIECFHKVWSGLNL